MRPISAFFLSIVLSINYVLAQEPDTVVNMSEEMKLPMFENFVDSTGGIHLEMIAVKGGTFTMGSNMGEDDELPIHTVSVGDFYICKYELTQDQWIKVMGGNPSCVKNGACSECPVECVSWYEVQDFIRKLNAKSNRKYRLPTEAEWEYAAGWGANKQYIYAGTSILDSIDSYAWHYTNGNSTSHKVGQKKPNGLGLYDMSGNVYEWCNDWYGESYYSSSPEVNPQGELKGASKVIKGGAWGRTHTRCRVANRDYYSPNNSYDLIGFRLVVSED